MSPMAIVRIILGSFELLLVVYGGVSATTVVLEQGYVVTTLIDANKMGFNPHSILPRFASSDFVILDSARSHFYTISSPISQVSVVERLAGNGTAGFADGDLGSSMFNSPNSFAIDVKGNVYVADKGNHVIRKITRSGVTTIAGGSFRKVGYVDGPAQQAQFSDDFDLTFVPGMCALLISDHGNNRIRQIDLKREDCQVASRSALGSTYIWILGMGIACILGVIIGFVARPYITSRTGSAAVSQFDADMENLPNQSGETSSDFLLRHQKRISSETDFNQSGQFSTQLKDLIVLDGSSEPLSSLTCPTQPKEDFNEVATTSTSATPLDTMIYANLTDFVTKSTDSTWPESAAATSGLLRRRQALTTHQQGS